MWTRGLPTGRSRRIGFPLAWMPVLDGARLAARFGARGRIAGFKSGLALIGGRPERIARRDREAPPQPWLLAPPREGLEKLPLRLPRAPKLRLFRAFKLLGSIKQRPSLAMAAQRSGEPVPNALARRPPRPPSIAHPPALPDPRPGLAVERRGRLE